MKSYFLAASLVFGGMTVPAAGEAHIAQDHVGVLGQQAPGYYRIKLGDFLITAITDGGASAPYAELLRGMTQAEFEAQFAKQGQKSDRFTSINMFLIDTGEKRVLIDAGAGAIYGDCCGQMPKQLAAAGYTLDSIDAVLLTHVHADHSFGLTKDGVRMFPNADIYVGKGELDHWLDEAKSQAAKPSHQAMFIAGKAALTPYIAAGRVKALDEESDIFTGIRAVPAYGHTPGHNFYDIESQGVKMRVIGDMIHVAEVQLPMPQITIDFDVDQGAAAKLRYAALKEIADTKLLVAAPHINFPGLGYIVPSGAGYAWSPLSYSAAIPQIAR